MSASLSSHHAALSRLLLCVTWQPCSVSIIMVTYSYSFYASRNILLVQKLKERKKRTMNHGDCPVLPDLARFEEATHRTTRWLDRCLAAHKRPQEQNLFPIVQVCVCMTMCVCVYDNVCVYVTRGVCMTMCVCV
jgi:hypothetical protein